MGEGCFVWISIIDWGYVIFFFDRAWNIIIYVIRMYILVIYFFKSTMIWVWEKV